jgi:plastocyanin
MRRRVTVGMLMLGAAVGGSATAISADVAASAVTIKLFHYRPPRLTVTPGTRVVWTNEDEILHTVTGLAGVAGARAIEGTLDGKGASTALTFTERGVYPYVCERHPHMRGEIRVE